MGRGNWASRGLLGEDGLRGVEGSYEDGERTLRDARKRERDDSLVLPLWRLTSLKAKEDSSGQAALVILLKVPLGRPKDC